MSNGPTEHQLSEFDIVFLSYDEPNAEKHYADLLDKAHWAKRVHGVKGFDAAHRAAAELSETDWFVTVDADNIVLPEFFDEKVTLGDNPRQCFSWNGLNQINGLIYGNGGLKLWSKEFVLSGGVGHESATDDAHAVDFCWQPDYRQVHKTFSHVYPNASSYQAFRAGFREGVKLSLDRGQRVSAADMAKRLHPINLRNLRVWCCVGADVENGDWAMLGARMGWSLMLDLSWDHRLVSDFNWFQDTWTAVSGEVGHRADRLALNVPGAAIRRQTGITLPILDDEQSEFFRETFKLRNE